MKLNVASIIAEHAEKRLEFERGEDCRIYTDLIPHEYEGACLRHDPSPAAERRFCDGSRLLQWNLTLYVRRLNAERARDLCKAFTDELDGATIADPETGTQIDCEAATLPQFIGIDEKDLTTYAAAITARYLEEQ